MKQWLAQLPRFLVVVLSLVLFFSLTGTSEAHSWANYHWARTANPFTLKLGDNLSSSWDPYLVTTSSDWSVSSVLDTTIVGGGTSSKRCRPTNGRVEVCNNRYGRNGWLGLAQIWVSGDHITQAVSKVNDTYFATSTYNTPSWKNLVMCQEVGHTFGLDHQDEAFDNPNLGTCMDYTSDPDGPPSNEHPNAHDYEELEVIYAHLDSFTTVGQTSRFSFWQPKESQAFLEGIFEDPQEWGRTVRETARTAIFERDFGHGLKLVTSIIKAE